MSEFDDFQRRRMRANAHLYIRHDAHRFMPPGSPLYVGKDVLKYFWPERAREPSSPRRGEMPLHRRGVVSDREFETELRQLRCDIASLRLEWELLKFASKARDSRKYSSNQPRVPAGSPRGGRWTSDGAGATEDEVDAPGRAPAPEEEPQTGKREVVHDHTGQESWETVASEYRRDGALARQTIINRDASTIHSEFSDDPHKDEWDERHTVRLADGSVTTFQNSGAVQSVFDSEGQRISQSVWPPGGAEPEAIVQPAFAPAVPPAVALGAIAGRVAVQKSIEAGLTLLTWLSSQNSDDARAVLSFSAGEFRAEGPKDRPVAIWVGRLKETEVNSACKKLSEVQKLTDKGIDEINKDGQYKGPADFGTKVHKYIKDKVNGERDDNYKAEVSVLKSLDAALNEPSAAEKREAVHYGQLDTIRVDVLENRPAVQTVCNYDIKTGKARLWVPRMSEIAETVLKNYPNTKRIIVTEVKPSRR